MGLERKGIDLVFPESPATQSVPLKFTSLSSRGEPGSNPVQHSPSPMGLMVQQEDILHCHGFSKGEVKAAWQPVTKDVTNPKGSEEASLRSDVWTHRSERGAGAS